MSVQPLLQALRRARAVDLEHPRKFGDPIHPAHQPGTVFTLHRRHEAGTGEPRTSASGIIITAEHAGTHIDAICHQAERMTLFDGVAISPAVQTSAGFTRHGIETVAPIIARGVLLDLAALRGGRLPDRTLVSAADLEDALRAQRSHLSAGDVLLVRTGNDTVWVDPARYLAGPGMSAEASEWAAAQRVRAVGSDNVAWDVPGYVDARIGSSLPGHAVLLVRHGIHIVENLDLQELSRGRHLEFVFLCLPLKIQGGTGCPVRPVALVADGG